MVDFSYMNAIGQWVCSGTGRCGSYRIGLQTAERHNVSRPPRPPQKNDVLYTTQPGPDGVHWAGKCTAVQSTSMSVYSWTYKVMEKCLICKHPAHVCGPQLVWLAWHQQSIKNVMRVQPRPWTIMMCMSMVSTVGHVRWAVEAPKPTEHIVPYTWLMWIWCFFPGVASSSPIVDICFQALETFISVSFVILSVVFLLIN